MKANSYSGKFLHILCLLVLFPIGLFAQIELDILSIKTFSSLHDVPSGGSVKIAIQLDINPEYHINSNEPLDPAYIATEVRFKPVEGVSFGKIIFPESDRRSFGFSDDELAIFDRALTAAEILEIYTYGIK